MSLRLRLKKFQIALLESQAENLKSGSITVPSHVRWSFHSMGPTAYIEGERRRHKKELRYLEPHIKYLKRQHYLERVKEGEEILYKLTAKGEYEILKLNFALHIFKQKQQPWNKKFYLAVFDVPEEKRRYRDVFRRLLKDNGFRALQRSVWMSRYDPRPAIGVLLSYLGIEKHFEVMEIDCKACSPRLNKKIS